MAPHTNGTSRAASRLASRASSVARDIVKRRDKPYKTEQQRVLAKRKKLNLHTSYSAAPRGFTHVPVGTPELSGRCKELSRQRNVPVYVVNAWPVSDLHQDPRRVAHHVHRIGYHFRSDVVADACIDLDYVYRDGRFIKVIDLETERQQNQWTKTLAKYGLKDYNFSNGHETHDQVRAAIKELFPRIPDRDLGEIVEHAWKEGTSRVGNSKGMELSRRVQLAVIARIRHTYTDYDYLLRAFGDWADARRQVEQPCLKKLIEWRGEDNADDEGLEEIVRETIVIDDDDEDDSGDMSDTDLEITATVAAENELGDESMDERAKSYADRLQPNRHKNELRNNIARQKIDAARQKIKEGRREPLAAQPAPLNQIHTRNGGHPQPAPVSDFQVRMDEQGKPLPVTVGPDGRIYVRLVSDEITGCIDERICPFELDKQEQANPHPLNHGHVPQHLAPAAYLPDNGHIPQYLASAAPHGQTNNHQSGVRGAFAINSTHDRPVASIERDEYGQLAALPHGPMRPKAGPSSKRWGVSPPAAARGEKVDHLAPFVGHTGALPATRERQAIPPGVEIMDLVTPERPAGGRKGIEVIDLASPNLKILNGGGRLPTPKNGGHSWTWKKPVTENYFHALDAGVLSKRPPPSELPPMPRASARVEPVPDGPSERQYPAPTTGPPFQHVQVVSTAGPPRYEQPQPHLPSPYAQQPRYTYDKSFQPVHPQAQVQQPAYRQVVYQPAPSTAPPPVHGAPAPVQWAPQPAFPGYPTPPGAAGLAAIGSQGPVVIPRPSVPADGGIAPTQYYYNK
jgi:hypothetical protein